MFFCKIVKQKITQPDSILDLKKQHHWHFGILKLLKGKKEV